MYRAKDPVADALMKLMVGTRDLEEIARTKQLPKDLFWIRELAKAGRRLFTVIDSGEPGGT